GASRPDRWDRGSLSRRLPGARPLSSGAPVNTVLDAHAGATHTDPVATGWGRAALIGVMLSLPLTIVPMGLGGASTPSSADTQVSAAFSGAEGEYTPLAPK